MNEKRVPQIRFAGLDEEWEERRLGNVVSVIGGGTPSTNNPAYWDGDIDWFSPSEIGKNAVAPRSRLRITSEGLARSSAQLLPADRTVLFTSRASIGHSAILRHEAATNQGFQSFVMGPGADVEFIHAMTSKIKVYAFSRASGSTFLEVSAGALRDMPFYMPKLDEQNRIGSFFSELEGLIAQHRKKLAKLQQTKASLLQKMFPRGDADKPELRLGGFSAAWVKVRFLDVIRSITDFRGRTPKKLGMDWSDHGYLALSANNVKNGYIDFTRDPHYGDESLYEKWMSGQELHKGQVLFTTEAPMGNVARVPDSRKYILSQRVIAFEVDQAKVTEAFLAVLLGSPSTFCQLAALSSGGTAQGISQRSLAQVEVVIPRDLGEQAKISSTFEYLNSLILTQQHYIEKLKQTKASLLQKMFV